MIPTETGLDPVRWWLFDDWHDVSYFPGPPTPDWPGWEARYENEFERGKRTSRDTAGLVYSDLLFRMRSSVSSWSRYLNRRMTDDPLLHGGGLHVIDPGGHLMTHLDYDRHPFTLDKRRSLNLILFVHPKWEPEWGGQFYFTGPSGAVLKLIEPRPGRLLAFETTDLAYHGVRPVTGPEPRASLSCFFLEPAGPQNTRTRALFLPPR